MLHLMPPSDDLYRALVNRDAALDGRVWVGVTSTGIFCRLTCPARKPKPENCRWFDTIGGCLDAGFRACKRCQPLGHQQDADTVRLLAALDADPTRRWSEEDIAALGLDPSTVRRTFKRHFGRTFLDMARDRRLAAGFTTLAGGGAVIAAQLDAGYTSGSAFRQAFAGWLGLAPGDIAGDGLLRAATLDTPLGPMIAISDARHLHLLEFSDRAALPNEVRKLAARVHGSIGIGRFDPTDQIEQELTGYFAGTRGTFDTPLAYHGSPFAQSVWRALRTIPAGQTRSYSAVAATIGHPTATRAVARANGANQIVIAVPCHRVIGADGSLTGYGGGLWRKSRLLDIERQYLNPFDHRTSA